MILYLLPIISALIGWFIFSIAGKIIVRKAKETLQQQQPELAAKLGAWVSAELVNFGDIASKLKDPSQLKAVHPIIETHLDNFLKVKLQEKLPVISMFVSESMLEQVKEGMIDEIELLLPEVIGKYADSLTEKLDIGKTVTNKLSAYPIDKLEPAITAALGKPLYYLKIAGAIAGFIIAWINIAMILTTHAVNAAN